MLIVTKKDDIAYQQNNSKFACSAQYLDEVDRVNLELTDVEYANRFS